MTRSIAIGVASLALVTGLVAGPPTAVAVSRSPARSTSPIKWHQVSVPSGSLLTGGPTALARDGGGDLHAIFTSDAAGAYQYWDAKFTPLGAASGSVHKVFSSAWTGGLSATPWLVPGTKTTPMLLVFSGSRGTSDVYNNGCLYGATSATGATWTLSAEGYSTGCVNFAFESTTMVGTTPYTVWQQPLDGFTYHVGAGPAIPASGSDTTVSLGVGGGTDLVSTVSALDAKGGAHFAVAGFEGLSSTQSKNGTYAWDTSIGTSSHARKAPKSSPIQAGGSQRVAMVSGGSGHIPYVAYCTGTTTTPCTGVRLWNVLSNSTIGLGGSKGASLVAASAGPAGRVWVAFYKTGTPGTITVARTNKAVTKFGPERTYKAPPLVTQATLTIEGSQGRLDIFMSGDNAKIVPSLFHAQVLAPLTLKASKTSLPTSGGSITFTVLDAGAPVQGATVSLLGKTGTTGAKGTVTLKFGKNKAGTYTATAKKSGYAGAKLKIK
ncbi:MAG: hypothetical protein ACXVWF_06845, partial [Actinomycetota bacterium]